MLGLTAMSLSSSPPAAAGSKRPRLDAPSPPASADEDLSQWTRDRLEAEVRRLRGAAAVPVPSSTPAATPRRVKEMREFDMGKYWTRHVALKVAYFGWDYSGLEAQEEHTDQTIETQMFAALKRARLVVDRHSCSYSRCGRTDKGVSAFQQVLALKLRSTATRDQALPAAADELDYPAILNRILPDDIRVIAWAPVADDFSARFSCVSRMYKYLIPSHGLDVALMEQAAKQYIGTHDFTYLCKINKSNANLNYVRTVYDVTLEPLKNTAHLEYAWGTIMKCILA